MDEELTTQTAEEEVSVAQYDEPSAEPQEAPAPEPSDDIAERLAAIEKREKELQKGFEEIARRERAVTQPTPQQAPAAEPELDPEAQKILDRYFEQKVTPISQTNELVAMELFETQMEQYAKEAGVDFAELQQTVYSRGLIPRAWDRASRAEVLDTAAKIIKGSREVDIDSLVNAKVEERLKELAEQGIVPAGPPVSRAEESAPEAVQDLDYMEPQERIAWYKAKGFLRS